MATDSTKLAVTEAPEATCSAVTPSNAATATTVQVRRLMLTPIC